jgi:hypothetical protein
MLTIVCCAVGTLEFSDDTLLYVNDVDRLDVYYQLESDDDIVDKASFKVLSRKALHAKQQPPQAAHAAAQAQLTPLQQQKLAAARNAAARRQANNAPAEFLPNGRVRIGQTIYQVCCYRFCNCDFSMC